MTIWCTECGRTLIQSFILDAYVCPHNCHRIGISNEAIWRLNRLLKKPTR